MSQRNGQQHLYRSFLAPGQGGQINSNSRQSTYNQGYINLQRRIQESIRDVRHSRQNLNMLMNISHAHDLNSFGVATNELGMMLFNSPCKLHYSVNDSEWSEGIDLNLMNLKKAPLNFVLSMPPEMHRTTELIMSRAAYFSEWEMIPKQQFLLTRKEEEP